jgi:hypothetical protein
MGYYTTYELSVELSVEESVELSEDNLISKFRAESEGARQAIDEYGCSIENCKWYDHKEDLESFSFKYPNVLFTLYGHGEDDFDMWRLYVKNGKTQTAKASITFADFDENKLK